MRKKVRPDLKIDGWRGRLGNNIIQVRNCLHMAFAMGVNVSLPRHPHFNKTYISTNGRPRSKSHISDPFWHRDMIRGHTIPVASDHRRQVHKVIRELLFVNPRDATQAGENTLVIHIRSGDIFGSRNPHSGYIMPPFCFYVHVIEKSGTRVDKIHLVAEDTLNPCINLLRERYSNLVFKISSLAEDVRTIIGARKIVFGTGTFVPQLLAFSSDSLTEIYRPSNTSPPSLVGYSCKDNVIDISDYINKIGSWKNTPAQRQLMCDYEFPDV